jgi:hypothetical protein
MRYLATSILTAVLSSCATSTAPLYGWKSVIQGTDVMAFDDDAIHIEFKVRESDLGFTLVNKTDTPINIDWDAMSFVGWDGESRRVIHNGTALANGNQAQAVTRVPPRGKISDGLLPAENVFWVQGYANEYGSSPGHWSARPMMNMREAYPLRPGSVALKQYAKPWNGKTFGIYMPLAIGESKVDHTFTFEISTFCAQRCKPTAS